jgi:hypothetical protein
MKAYETQEKIEIPEELWRKACENMARASDETVEMFGVMINNTNIIPFDFKAVKAILEYVASDKFLAEEGC